MTDKRTPETLREWTTVNAPRQGWSEEHIRFLNAFADAWEADLKRWQELRAYAHNFQYTNEYVETLEAERKALLEFKDAILDAAVEPNMKIAMRKLDFAIAALKEFGDG